MRIVQFTAALIIIGTMAFGGPGGHSLAAAVPAVPATAQTLTSALIAANKAIVASEERSVTPAAVDVPAETCLCFDNGPWRADSWTVD